MVCLDFFMVPPSSYVGMDFGDEGREACRREQGD